MSRRESMESISKGSLPARTGSNSSSDSSYGDVVHSLATKVSKSENEAGAAVVVMEEISPVCGSGDAAGIVKEEGNSLNGGNDVVLDGIIEEKHENEEKTDPLPATESDKVGTVGSNVAFSAAAENKNEPKTIPLPPPPLATDTETDTENEKVKTGKSSSSSSTALAGAKCEVEKTIPLIGDEEKTDSSHAHVAGAENMEKAVPLPVIVAEIETINIGSSNNTSSPAAAASNNDKQLPPHVAVFEIPGGNGVVGDRAREDALNANFTEAKSEEKAIAPEAGANNEDNSLAVAVTEDPEGYVAVGVDVNNANATEAEPEENVAGGTEDIENNPPPVVVENPGVSGAIGGNEDVLNANASETEAKSVEVLPAVETGADNVEDNPPPSPVAVAENPEGNEANGGSNEDVLNANPPEATAGDKTGTVKRTWFQTLKAKKTQAPKPEAGNNPDGDNEDKVKLSCSTCAACSIV